MVQLPAINTPQFSWCLTRMPRKPQPMPPIYQPEVAARAIVHAALNGPRELTVGGKNVLILWVSKFFPGLGDHYLARTAYEAQQHDGPPDPNRQVNLWEPVEADFGAHGEFDDRSKRASAHLRLSLHPVVTAILIFAVGILVAIGILALI